MIGCRTADGTVSDPDFLCLAPAVLAELIALMPQSRRTASELALEIRFPGVHFYNAALVEVQENVQIGAGSRVGSFALIQSGAVIGTGTTIGSHCNICDCRIGNNVSIQTGCHITRGVVVEDEVFIGPGVVTMNDKLRGDGATSFPRIGRNAKIGGGSCILPGVIIGADAVIGAGSVIATNVPPGTVVYGDPARVQAMNIGKS